MRFLFALVAAIVIVPAVSAPPVHAQQPGKTSIFEVATMKFASTETAPAPAARDDAVGRRPGRSRPVKLAAQGPSKIKRAMWASIAGAGGFFGGGFLGAAIEGDRCDCDDPGLVGFLVGAPIGTAVGAILGWKFGR